MDENGLSKEILGAAIEVHQFLGPGLLERTYELALAHELEVRGLKVETQVPVSMQYKALEIDSAYRIDILVNDLVVIEVKAVEKLLSIHSSQLLTYLRLKHKKLGLLLNFHMESMRDGIKRVVNNL